MVESAQEILNRNFDIVFETTMSAWNGMTSIDKDFVLPIEKEKMRLGLEFIRDEIAAVSQGDSVDIKLLPQKAHYKEALDLINCMRIGNAMMLGFILTEQGIIPFVIPHLERVLNESWTNCMTSNCVNFNIRNGHLEDEFFLYSRVLGVRKYFYGEVTGDLAEYSDRYKNVLVLHPELKTRGVKAFHPILGYRLYKKDVVFKRNPDPEEKLKEAFGYLSPFYDLVDSLTVKRDE